MPKPQTPSPTIRKPPTLEAVEAFVAGDDTPEPKPVEKTRPRKDRKSGSSLRHPPPPQEIIRKRLTVDVPIDHWWALKTRSMHEGLSLQQILSTAIAQMVEPE